MFFFFFFNDPAPTEIYTLSLHDALPISNALRSSSLRQIDTDPERFRNGWVHTDRKSTRLNSSHVKISYAVFCLKKKKKNKNKNNYIKKTSDQKNINKNKTTQYYTATPSS